MLLLPGTPITEFHGHYVTLILTLIYISDAYHAKTCGYLPGQIRQGYVNQTDSANLFKVYLLTADF